MEGHKYGIYCLTLSKSNKWLFSGSTDNTIGVWTCGSRKNERFLDGHKSTVVGLSLSQNESFLFSMSKNGLVLSWNLKTFKIANKVTAFSASNSSLCFCLSDPIYTIFGRDIRNKGTLRAVNLISGETVKSIKIHKKNLRCMILDHCNQYLFTGGTDGVINILTVTNCEIEKKIKAHSSVVNSLSISRDDRFLASASDDRTVKIFDLHENYSMIRQLKHQVEVSFLLFSKKNKHLLTGGWNLKPIKIWDLTWLDITEQKYQFEIPGKHFLIQSPYNWNRECGKTTQQKVKENIVNFEEGMKHIDNYALTKTTLDYLDTLAQLKPGVSLKKEKDNQIAKRKSTFKELDKIKDFTIPELDYEAKEIKEKFDIIESSEMNSLAMSELKEKNKKKVSVDEGVTFKSRRMFRKRMF